MARKYRLKIFRGLPEKQYWEEFELELRPGENVISSLMEIRKNPINRKGERVEPVVWEDGCLEEVCGSCSMLVNGYPRQACTALIENILNETKKNTINLAPFTKFPLIRDLIVDRTRMFDNLKRMQAWIKCQKSEDTGFGPKVSQKEQELMYTLSTCMTCGCCSESCPQVNKRSCFVGPAPVAQARLFNTNPTGKNQKKSRLRPLMEEGGISECGNAQNCVEVCPKNLPLTESISAMGRSVVLQSFRDLFHLDD